MSRTDELHAVLRDNVQAAEQALATAYHAYRENPTQANFENLDRHVTGHMNAVRALDQHRNAKARQRAARTCPHGHGANLSLCPECSPLR